MYLLARTYTTRSDSREHRVWNFKVNDSICLYASSLLRIVNTNDLCKKLFALHNLPAYNLRKNK